MLPAPEGQWAMPKEIMQKLPGYDPDIAKSRAEAQKIMQPSAMARTSTSRSRSRPGTWRFIAIPPRSSPISSRTSGSVPSSISSKPRIGCPSWCAATSSWRKASSAAASTTPNQQSAESDQEKRRRLVSEIDRRLQDRVVRPILYHMRQATCWRPEVKGLNIQVNSIYNGWRMEEVWLDK
jgi:peptide/nickel transport system substrate-binding protein